MKVFLKSSLFLTILGFSVGFGQGGVSVPEADSMMTSMQTRKDLDWIKAFNGTDLKDWDAKIKGQELNVDPNNTFKVKDGNLLVDYSDYTGNYNSRFGHLFYNKKFSHYVIKSTYTWWSKQIAGGPGWANKNNGFMLHAQSAASMGKEQDFPISIEAQLLKNKTLNLCTPGTGASKLDGTARTSHCWSAGELPTQTVGQDTGVWIDITIIVLGDSIIHHYAQGKHVMSYIKPIYLSGGVGGYDKVTFDPLLKSKPPTPLKEGYITIQGESAPTRFKKIDILNLTGCMDSTYKEYRDYHLNNDSTKCKVKNSTSVASKNGLLRNQVNFSGRTALVAESGQHTLKIMDMTGKVLFEQTAEGKYAYDVSSVKNSGIYWVELKGQVKTYYGKVVLF